MKRLPCSVAVLAALSVACGSSSDGAPRETASPFANYPSGNSSSMTPGAPATPAAAGTNPGATPAPAIPGNANTETGPGNLPLGMMPATPGSIDSSSPAQPLPRSTPEAQGLSSDGVLKLVNALDAGVNEIHSLVLVRHGQVVAEGFWAPYSVDDVQVLYSGSKSFNATAVGMLADAGRLSVEDLVLSKFPELAPAQPAANMQSMRIKDLLTMSTGHAADTINTLRKAPNGEWTRAFLATEVQSAPGTKFVYNSGAAYLLSAIVQKVSGQTVDAFLGPRLFEPLGIQKHLWGLSPEGVNLGDGGLSVRTEDFAKFGLLYLQGGSWNGEQLISQEWVTDATKLEVATGNNDGNWNYGYGYQFWRSPVGFRADGSLGQFAFVLPDQDMVLAITAGTRNDGGTDNLMKLVFANLPPVQADALPENASSLQTLRDELAQLALPLPTGTASSPMAAGVSGSRYVVSGDNAQEIAAVSFDFATATPTLTFEDKAGPHAIPVGIGSWIRGRTGFRRHINELYDTPEQGIAAQGAWSAEDTFTARMVFTETPYTAITSFKFDGDRVLVDTSYSVRWSNQPEPQVVGTR
jgi:CubicO group peptidase (beta-lactamase class C family)